MCKRRTTHRNYAQNTGRLFFIPDTVYKH